MKQSILLFLLFIAFHCVSQEKYVNSRDSIYIENDLVYKKKDYKLFSGTIEFTGKKDRLSLKEEYQDGYIIKSTRYYNTKKKSVRMMETYYHEKQPFKKQKEITYHYHNEKMFQIEMFDLNKQRTLKQQYNDDGKLIFSCEYKNGKKHGRKFCSSEECDVEAYYENGKKVK